MMTDDKPVCSIHADNLARLAPRTVDTNKDQTSLGLVIAADLAVGDTGLLSAQVALRCGAAYLAFWLHACAGERSHKQDHGVATSYMCDSIRLLLEEHSPCQALSYI